MARDGYLIIDSDLHMMEPDDLWVRYLESPIDRPTRRGFSAGSSKSWPRVPRIRQCRHDRGN